jgi:hypothetical protein
MYVQMNCVIVDADNANREELASFLVRFGALPVAQFPNIEPLAGVLAKPDGPLLAIVNLDPNPQDTLKKIAGLPRQFPAVNFFLMSQTIDPNLLMEAMHLGIKEFIPLPMSEDKFTTALERVAAVHGMGKRARIIHVVPTIGGCGSTTVACNVAAALAPIGKTVLIDMDLIRGGAASFFDIRCRYTIADVMDAAEKLDKQLLDNALTIHKKTGGHPARQPERSGSPAEHAQPGLRLRGGGFADEHFADVFGAVAGVGRESAGHAAERPQREERRAVCRRAAPHGRGIRQDLHGGESLREKRQRHRAAGDRAFAGHQAFMADSQRFQERDCVDQFRRAARAPRSQERNQPESDGTGRHVVGQASPGKCGRMRNAE